MPAITWQPLVVAIILIVVLSVVISAVFGAVFDDGAQAEIDAKIEHCQKMDGSVIDVRGIGDYGGLWCDNPDGVDDWHFGDLNLDAMEIDRQHRGGFHISPLFSWRTMLLIAALFGLGWLATTGRLPSPPPRYR